MRIILATLNSSFTHSSLALRYLRTAIAPKWPDHHLLEFQLKDDPRRVLTAIGKLQPQVVALSCYIWNIEASLALARDLKTVLPELKIILGGPEAGPRAASLLQECEAVDYIIAGEGEQALPKLLQTLTEIQQTDMELDGIYYRDREGAIRGRPAKPMPAEQIPRPYHQKDLAELKHKLVYYESSRGCPFRCTYCLSGRDPIRHLPLARVFTDLELLLNADISLIKFVDRTFNANPARALKIMQFLLARRRKNRFHFEICADILNEEMLAWLEQVPADVFQFEIGVQSVNSATLDAIQRRMCWPTLAKNVRRLREYDNIHLHLDLIAGLPYQDWQAIELSFDKVMNLKPHRLQLGFLKVLPGSEMERQAQKYGLKTSSLPPYEVLASKWLSFRELNRLHGIEQVLEYYYNSGLLAYSLPYLWKRSQAGPFTWFEGFAIYWEEKNLFRVAHGREALVNLVQAYAAQDTILHDLLTIDRARMVPSFPAHFKLPPARRSLWEDYLNANATLFGTRNYKQAFRTVFPLTLQGETLRYLGQEQRQVNTAVVDHKEKRVVDFISL